jgi:hypothetical protein
MTERQYKILTYHGILDKEYEIIDKILDIMGYSEYQDGTGDYGVRRLRNNQGDLISEVLINDMHAIRGEYPDFQFYDRVKDEIIGFDYTKILNNYANKI